MINLSKKQFDNLKEYQLPKYLFIAESNLYILPTTNKWKTVNKLLKRFHITNGPSFNNKLKTIELLTKYQNIINIKELVFPENLVSVENQIVGYTMELIPSINLEVALSSDEISIDRKIKYLYQIGEILEKMEYVRKYTELKDFYLNDIHENNFVIDLNLDNIKVVDLDSCKINNNITYTIGSRYLQANTIIANIPKYKQDENFPYGCSFLPTRDTDLYCYNIMILNFIYGGEIEKLSIEELYDYLEYLSSIGINPKIIDIFKKLVSNSPNENPYKLLKELIPYYGRTHKNVYKHIRSK